MGTTSSRSYHAVVLLRKDEEPTKAKVLLRNARYFTFPGPRGSELDIEIADDLGRAAKARAEEQLRMQGELQPGGGLLENVEVYATNPTTSPTVKSGEELTLAEDQRELEGDDVLAMYDARRFYVLVTLPPAETKVPGNRVALAYLASRCL